MKLNKTNVIKLREGRKTLKNYVINYILNRWDDYENKENIFLDVLHYGCQSGIVGDLIYFSQTVKFYNTYKEEINALLYDIMYDIGSYSPYDIFGEKWDTEDPLCLETNNQNLLAWFGFEETLRLIAHEFDIC